MIATTTDAPGEGERNDGLHPGRSPQPPNETRTIKTNDTRRNNLKNVNTNVAGIKRKLLNNEPNDSTLSPRTSVVSSICFFCEKRE